MEQSDLFLRFGVSLAIGFLVGLQREFAHKDNQDGLVAGERTFALFALTGSLGAMAADNLGSDLAFVGGLLVIGGMVALGYYIKAQQGQIGLTSEVAALVVVFTGALCYWGHLTLAVAIAIATTVILSLKLETDRFVEALTREDVMATLQLAVISAIVLPVLPDKSFFAPPFDVLNPFKIWLMVVFISGISFLGYVLIKFVGPRQGIGLTGLLGGMVSSTAVTLSFSERSNQDNELARPFAFAIIISWTVMFVRVLVEVGVVNPALLGNVWVPIGAVGLVGLVYCLYLYFAPRPNDSGDIEFSNPFDLATAIKFGLLYGVVLLVSRTAQVYFDDTGIFLASILSGLADVDAITLSLAELSRSGGLDPQTATQGIVLAAMSNTLVKSGIVFMSGAKALRKILLPGVVLMIVTGIATAFLF